MSLLSSLRAIFNPPTVTPHTPVEDHPGAIKKPSQIAVTAPTFSPAVPWATQDNQLPLSAVTAPPVPQPPAEDPMDCYRGAAGLSGCFIQYTDNLRANLCYTGMVMHSPSPHHFYTTG